MLVVDQLTVKYVGASKYALMEASLTCELSGITALVGRSGVGKTTLMGMVAGTYLPNDPLMAHCAGTILVDGERPASMRGATKVSWVPQTSLLLDHLDVIENVMLPLSMKGIAASDRARAEHLLAELGLKDGARSRPKELSGGMRAMVSVARALVSEPAYLFMDEPFVGLDLMSRWKIYTVLRRLRGARGRATLLTTHDIGEAAMLADRIVVIKEHHGRTLIRVSENNAALSINTAALSTNAHARACFATARATAASVEESVFFDRRNC